MRSRITTSTITYFMIEIHNIKYTMLCIKNVQMSDDKVNMYLQINITYPQVQINYTTYIDNKLHNYV